MVCLGCLYWCRSSVLRRCVTVRPPAYGIVQWTAGVGDPLCSRFELFMMTHFNMFVSIFRDWFRWIGMTPSGWTSRLARFPAIVLGYFHLRPVCVIEFHCFHASLIHCILYCQKKKYFIKSGLLWFLRFFYFRCLYFIIFGSRIRRRLTLVMYSDVRDCSVVPALSRTSRFCCSGETCSPVC